MKLHPGDIVTTVMDSVGLHHTMPRPVINLSAEEEATVTSELRSGEIAIVVALSNSDGRCVYLIGPRSCGWVFGAALVRL